MSRARLLLLCACLVASTGRDARAFEDQVFVVTSDGTGPGSCAAFDPLPPWAGQLHLEPVGRRPSVRHFRGLHYVVHRAPDASVQVIDPATFETLQTLDVGPATDPQDIAVVGPGVAYVSRRDSRWLLRLNPETGALLDSLDLGGFADADGLPEMSMMALDGSHLFVQLQRVSRDESAQPVPPGQLAVVDATSHQLVDADPTAPGIQAIRLQGNNPSFKMQIEPQSRRLFVSSPGTFLDGAGRIEEVDLDALAVVGTILYEGDAIPDIGAFVLVSPTKGYVLTHTDLLLSSHLTAFSRLTGTTQGELAVTFEMVESLGYDAETGLLFFPDPNDQAPGLRVFDVAADTELTTAPIPTGLPPVDLVIARQGVTDASSELHGRAVACFPNPSRGGFRLSFTSPGPGPVQVAVHDLQGRTVQTLAARAPAAGAPLTVRWDGRDHAGRMAPPGAYVVRVTTAGRTVTAKAVVFR